MTEGAGESGATPAALGFRWPAEWEPHAATWLAWPHNEDTWPDRLERVERAFARIVGALSGREEVRIAVGDARLEERARSRIAEQDVDPDRGVRFARIPTDDAWIRDHGPLFVAREGELAVVDFAFDAWGGKYPPWDRDAAVAARVAELLRLRRFRVPCVLEPGSIDGNGRGCVLTTESCLLHPNRAGAGPPRTREAMEAVLRDALGARSVLWLAGGIEGDDTDGHVDDVTRFVGPSTVVSAIEEDEGDPNHAPLRENLARLRRMRDAEGKPLDVVTLPMPPPVVERGARCPASYANFHLANGVALVPVFGVASDARALAVLAECLPDREVVPIPSRDLVVGLGAVHCLTQQEPRVAPTAA